MLCGVVNYAVRIAAVSITSCGVLAAVMAVGGGGVSCAMDASER
jgi:hypothetical protein